jgi:hypothetical protein
LCTITHEHDLQRVIDHITSVYPLGGRLLYVFSGEAAPEQLYCTYNVMEVVGSMVDNTILIHRKKETNTLYTINALNTVILEANGGVLDRSFVIDWQAFRNTLLITVDKKVQAIRLTLKSTVQVGG